MATPNSPCSNALKRCNAIMGAVAALFVLICEVIIWIHNSQGNPPEYDVTTHHPRKERIDNSPNPNNEDRIKTLDFLFKFQNAKPGEDPFESFTSQLSPQGGSPKQKPDKSINTLEVNKFSNLVSGQDAVDTLDILHELQNSKSDQHSSDPLQTKKTEQVVEASQQNQDTSDKNTIKSNAAGSHTSILEDYLSQQYDLFHLDKPASSDSPKTENQLKSF